MPDRFGPINPKCPHFLHGGDYNPDQWPEEVWAEDMRLMKLAGCNAMSVGIFSWVHLEPADGEYTFGWLDRIMDLLADNGAYAVVATPSAAQPAWMSAKYPEVLRAGPDGIRKPHGRRVNFCPSSPVYRRKVQEMNARLAERYADHPALLVWHISNEYGGSCHCDACIEHWRAWLQARYGSLEALNHAWWNAFWGHTYTDWSQIGRVDASVNAMSVDWLRFATDHIVDFMKREIEPLRRFSDAPVTHNCMGLYPHINFWKMVDHIDVLSWDAYPSYHNRPDDWKTAVEFSFTHDIYRAMKKGKPWMLMESSPSATNWMPVGKLNRPGVHLAKSLQAVAHGSDTVQYFQWRKSRGSHEKFHGAVVDHAGHEKTRVFEDVAEVGRVLAKLDDVIGTTTRPEAAILYDWENRWAIEHAAGPRKERKDYPQTCVRHYQPFWSRGIPVDVLDMDCDFSGYKVLIAPMLYMVREGVGERIRAFVEAGGTFVTTYLSGIADASDLCFLGGWPGPLREVCGVWAEEIDALYDDEANSVVPVQDNALGLSGAYKAEVFCDRIHAEGAEVLATYGGEFYAGEPAVTVNAFGRGRAYYIASRNDERFLNDFYAAVAEQAGLKRVLASDLPHGVTAQVRGDGERKFIFLLNFSGSPAVVDLAGRSLRDVVSGRACGATVELAGFDARVLSEP